MFPGGAPEASGSCLRQLPKAVKAQQDGFALADRCAHFFNNEFQEEARKQGRQETVGDGTPLKTIIELNMRGQRCLRGGRLPSYLFL